VIEQGCLAGAKETGEDRDRNCVGVSSNFNHALYLLCSRGTRESLLRYVLCGL
jgi:hypothetical protein